MSEERTISERDLVAPALQIANEQPNGFVYTSDLIDKLWDLFQPTGRDAELIPNRNDSHFSQKVRNMISHRNSDSSFIAKGLAEYDDHQKGLRITEKGRETLNWLSPR